MPLLRAEDYLAHSRYLRCPPTGMYRYHEPYSRRLPDACPTQPSNPYMYDARAYYAHRAKAGKAWQG